MKEKITNQKLKNTINDFFIVYLKKNKIPKERAKIYMSVIDQFVSWLEQKYKITYSGEIFVNHILEFHADCFNDIQVSFVNMLFEFGKYAQQIGEYEPRKKDK